MLSFRGDFISDSLLNSGEKKTNQIPLEEGRLNCFTESPQLNAKKRIVSYCSGQANWDGLSANSIITLDIENNTFKNQYWGDNNWLGVMQEKFSTSEAGFDFLISMLKIGQTVGFIIYI